MLPWNKKEQERPFPSVSASYTLPRDTKETGILVPDTLETTVVL